MAAWKFCKQAAIYSISRICDTCRKDIFEFKKRSIRHITRTVDLLTSYFLRVKCDGAIYRRSKINGTSRLRMYYGSIDA